MRRSFAAFGPSALVLALCCCSPAALDTDAGVDAEIWADADAELDATDTESDAVAREPICSTSWTTGFVTLPMPPQTERFQVTIDATPTHDGMDGVAGLCLGVPGSYDDLAVIVRFNDAGEIDARDGDEYQGPDAPIRYRGGVTYRFRLDVDMAQRTYSAFVTAEGGTEQTIGVGLAFRTSAEHLATLDAVALMVNPSTSEEARHRVCNVQVNPDEETDFEDGDTEDEEERS